MEKIFMPCFVKGPSPVTVRSIKPVPEAQL